jgi:pyruvate dehydrogenase E2 component (dihydrolipoamide acetyltransferase)
LTLLSVTFTVFIYIAPTAPAGSAASTDRIFASPLARKLAAEKGLSLASVSRGSGFDGSITAKDLQNLAPGTVAPPAASAVSGAAPAPVAAVPAPAGAGQKFVDLPVSNIRGVIAKRLLQSKQTIPHYYLTVILFFFFAISKLG